VPALLTIGSMIKCSGSVAPIPLLGVPTSVLDTDAPVATIDMMVPFLNILDFGLCTSEVNPEVIAAKIVGSPGAPCVPIVVDPWDPPSDSVIIDGMPAALASSKCMCVWAGEISVEIDPDTAIEAA
jgi:Domain of unknown function (DUF4280)